MFRPVDGSEIRDRTREVSLGARRRDRSRVVVKSLLSIESMGVGEGFLSSMWRVAPEYSSVDQGAPPWPSSLVVKLTPPLFEQRILGKMFGLFESEIRCMADDVPGRVGLGCPETFFAHYDPFNGRCILILEV